MNNEKCKMFRESVICKECKYFEIDKDGLEFCNAPGNIEIKTNYKVRYEMRKSEPRHINVNGSCKWYKTLFWYHILIRKIIG